jgi:acetylornithine/succinyldiaminopimelate/putrescine aminotransferase
MVLAKSIGGGMVPNAAIVYRDIERLTGYVDNNPSFHASCGGGTDIGCLIGMKVLDYIVENKIPENAARQGARIKDALTEVMRKHPKLIKEVRGIGMMLAIEYRYKFMGSLMSDCLSMSGMFAAYSGNAPQVMRFMLAPTMTDTEVDEALDSIHRAVKRMKQQGGFLAMMSKIPPVGKLLDDDKFMIRLGNWVRGG